MPLFLIGVKDKESPGEPWVRFAVAEAVDYEAAVRLGNDAADKLMEGRGGRMHGEAEELVAGRWYRTWRFQSR